MANTPVVCIGTANTPVVCNMPYANTVVSLKSPTHHTASTYVTTHEKTNHSLQNNFFLYQAVKSEKCPYLEIRLYHQWNLPFIQRSYTHCQLLPFDRTRGSLLSGWKYRPTYSNCKSESVSKLRAIRYNYSLFTALLQPSVERCSMSASNLPGGTPVS